jgi:hypothetical protein
MPQAEGRSTAKAKPEHSTNMRTADEAFPKKKLDSPLFIKTDE